MVTKTRESTPETESTTSSGRSKVGILIVDDDATKRFALRTILAPLDEDVVEASSGADALRQLLRHEFAVVLLDVTALDQAETDMGRGYTLGAVDFVFAPVVPSIMRAKVSVFVELYRAQQELRRYRTQLETLVEERTIALTAINRELEAFSYSVSHDLRAPLTSFDALSKTLLEEHGGKLDKRALEQLRKMREVSERMASVFDGLQMLFRLTSGEIRREQVDVSALAAEIVQELRAANRKRKVVVEIAPAITVNGDRRLVHILLSNLLNNAWKFTSAKPAARIWIGQEAVEGESRVFVKDDGVGLDMIDSHRLFGAFQRLHSQSEFAGAGIGLATARRIVNRHGGRIWAEGAVGEGATFYFVL